MIAQAQSRRGCFPATSGDRIDRVESAIHGGVAAGGEERARAMSIKRIWRGWTTPAQADSYERLLLTEVFAGIEAKGIPGYRGIELLRRRDGDEVEFVTIMTFDALQNVIDFQGEDYARAYVPAAAQQVLKRWDAVSTHHELIETRTYGPP